MQKKSWNSSKKAQMLGNFMLDFDLFESKLGATKQIIEHAVIQMTLAFIITAYFTRFYFACHMTALWQA